MISLIPYTIRARDDVDPPDVEYRIGINNLHRKLRIPMDRSYYRVSNHGWRTSFPLDIEFMNGEELVLLAGIPHSFLYQNLMNRCNMNDNVGKQWINHVVNDINTNLKNYENGLDYNDICIYEEPNGLFL